MELETGTGSSNLRFVLASGTLESPTEKEKLGLETACGKRDSNRKLFHLKDVGEIRDSFAKRDEGGDRNAWLYSYNPLTVELI